MSSSLVGDLVRIAEQFLTLEYVIRPAYPKFITYN